MQEPIKQKTTINFNIIACGFYDSQFVYRKMSISPDRTVDCFEFEYFPQSGGTSYINGTPHPIRRGNVLIAPPGCIRHSVLHFKAYYIHCQTENPLLRQFLYKLPHVSSFGEDGVKLEALFKQIIRSAASPEPEHILYTESKLLELIYRLANKLLPDDAQNNYSPVTLKAIEYIERNYHNNIQLKDMAEAVGLTPIYFHNMFSKNTGQTPHEYLLQKRLSAAKDLLSGSDMSLINIAAECGFSSQAYFTTIFRKYTDLTPLQFRQKAFKKYHL